MESESSNLFTSPAPQSWLKRNGFPNWVMAFIWVGVVFVGFQIIGGIGMVAIFFMNAEDTQSISAEGLMEIVNSDPTSLFLVNSIAQLLMIGLATFLVVRLHVKPSGIKTYMRLQSSNKVLITSVLGVLLFTVVQPAIELIGWLNSLLPVPELFGDLQDSMMESIKAFLQTDNSIVLGLLYIAAVPAIFEEILFRGYIMRSLEKDWGIMWAIIASSLIFGLFHLQLANVLPLATLGFLLAYLTWISDSLIPAIIAHFFNNGSQVVLSSLYPEMMENTPESGLSFPWYIIVLSLVFSIAIGFVLFRLQRKSNPDPNA